ncbi:hypothetical protein AMECASPLE_022423 [Ameca splendens]|uniref:Uncharacterized protein n=1 Tax=Ameca splendens TaxID=208324 RepID=A0ABV0ZP71_9TELE
MQIPVHTVLGLNVNPIFSEGRVRLGGSLERCRLLFHTRRLLYKGLTVQIFLGYYGSLVVWAACVFWIQERLMRALLSISVCCKNKSLRQVCIAVEKLLIAASQCIDVVRSRCCFV